ncbi:MAG: Ldh family oxidoreductase [bacterium]|nr:Ldh family oxidoreductase [bacterium]
MKDGRRLSPLVLHSWACEILLSTGASQPAAEATATALIDANLRGLDTHGLVLLRLYLPRLRSGAIDGRATPEIIKDLPGVVVVDARNTLGPYAATIATDLCCDRAESNGAAVTLVRRSNHFGAASVYSEQAVRRGCVAVVLSNSDPGLAPRGSLGPILGTNPLAIAVPARSEEIAPSLDMATSVVALGRVRAAGRAGDRLPLGWAIGPDGEPTEDPELALAGSLLPVGEHKGFALAFMIDTLAGCLTGARTSPSISADPAGLEPQHLGHFILAINVTAVASTASFHASVEELTGAVHTAERANDVPPFLIPGEREARVAAERRRTIPFGDGDLALLESLGRDYNVTFPGG